MKNKTFNLFKLQVRFYYTNWSWAVLPFICVDNNRCNRSRDLNIGWLCFHFSLELYKYPNK